MVQPRRSARDGDARPGSKRIGKYTLFDSLGKGGTGEVFLARAEGSGIDVALKLICTPSGSTRKILSQFMAETRIMLQLDHPNLVHILDSGLDPSGPFIVMEFLGSRTLRAELDAGGPSPSLIPSIGHGLLAAMVEIHRARILHRDLTPSNVILREGCPIIIDFGLARIADQESITRSRGLKTVLAYSPPERLGGEPHTMASDLYQAGLNLYEMVMKRHPFPETLPSRLATAQLLKRPPGLDGEQDGLPRHLGRLLARALEKSPQDRYASVQDLLEDWDYVWEYRPSSPSTSRRPTGAGRRT